MKTEIILHAGFIHQSLHLVAWKMFKAGSKTFLLKYPQLYVTFNDVVMVT